MTSKNRVVTRYKFRYSIMKKLLGIIFLSIFFCTNLHAGVTTGYKFGKGPLKLTKHMVNELEYFSGGKRGAYAEKQKLHGNRINCYFS